MDSLAYSSSSPVYLHDNINPYSVHKSNSVPSDLQELSINTKTDFKQYFQTSDIPYDNIRNTISSDDFIPKSLSLSIQPLNSSNRFLQLVSSPPATHRISGEISMQGTNKRRSQINTEFNDLFQSNSHTAIEHSDIGETPLDPYDNTSGEQRFCGGYGEWAHVVNHTERSILPDLKQYPFPDDIKNQADVIYNKMRYQVRRGKIRYQMLFFCIYCAHLELSRDVNPIQLGSQFGLTPGEVQRCDSLFSPLQTGYKPPSTNTSPLGYLPDYCRDMNLSQEAIDEIMKMATSVLRKDPTLYQENPQTVAAGLLRYYTITNGIITDDPQKITRVTCRSNVTIDGMFRRISAIDNS